MTPVKLNELTLSGLTIACEHYTELARRLSIVSSTIRAHALTRTRSNLCLTCGRPVYRKCIPEESGFVPCWRRVLHCRFWNNLAALPVIVDVLGNPYILWHPNRKIARRTVSLLKTRGCNQILTLCSIMQATSVIVLLLCLPIPRRRALSLLQIRRQYHCDKQAAVRRLRQ